MFGPIPNSAWQLNKFYEMPGLCVYVWSHVTWEGRKKNQVIFTCVCKPSSMEKALKLKI